MPDRNMRRRQGPSRLRYLLTKGSVALVAIVYGAVLAMALRRGADPGFILEKTAIYLAGSAVLIAIMHGIDRLVMAVRSRMATAPPPDIDGADRP